HSSAASPTTPSPKKPARPPPSSSAPPATPRATSTARPMHPRGQIRPRRVIHPLLASCLMPCASCLLPVEPPPPAKTTAAVRRYVLRREQAPLRLNSRDRPKE